MLSDDVLIATELKEDAYNQRSINTNSEESKPSANLQIVLDDLLNRLHDKRLEFGRPQDISLMSSEEVQDEKLAVQKALLHYESLHGRPTTKEEKDVMRPLYDRYRQIKRILTKSAPITAEPDLQTVPEDQAIDLEQTGSSSRWAATEGLKTLNDFSVTQDLNLLRDTIQPLTIENLAGNIQPSNESDDTNQHLHNLSMDDLHEELESVNKEKKKLRKVLRQYEEDFYRDKGRKVQKEDRLPLSNEYLEYKQVKARLKLLEVLLAKR